MTDERTDGEGLLEMPAGARMLTTLGMARKTPGRCACGEHAEHDEQEHTEDR